MAAHLPELVLVPAGRQLSFPLHPAESAHIFRRVGGPAGPWHRVAIHARFPYLDEDVLAPGTFIEYYVHVTADTETLKDHSHLVSITT